MSTPASAVARVVGAVLDRRDVLAYIDNGDGTETRVMRRRLGYACDEHGHVRKAHGCLHAYAASLAFRRKHRREREGKE